MENPVQISTFGGLSGLFPHWWPFYYMIRNASISVLKITILQWHLCSNYTYKPLVYGSLLLNRI